MTRLRPTTALNPSVPNRRLGAICATTVARHGNIAALRDRLWWPRVKRPLTGTVAKATIPAAW